MKPFLQGKKALAIEPLRLPGAAVAAKSRKSDAKGHGHAAGSAAGAAHVEVVKEGDKVVRLIVICGCGERTEIECLYPPGH